MRTLTGICALIITAMALTPLTGFAKGQGQGRSGDQPRERAQVERGQSDFDRDRMRDRDRIHEEAHSPAQDRDRVQDRTHAPDQAKFGDQDIYGQELMSVEERNQYREQLRLAESDPQQKTRLEANHREEMQVRARAQGVTLDEPPEPPEGE
jgi:hypothetical protein